MKTFQAYRPYVPHETHTEFQRNAEDQVQYEGCIFSDGRVVIRWLTAKGSTSVFDSMQDCMDIHGHSEYGTYLVWGDGRIENYVGDGKFEARNAVVEEIYAEQHEDMFYILDRQWPAIKSGDKSALHCNKKEHAEAFAAHITRNSERKAMHVSEMSDEDIEAVRNAKVPPGNEHLDDLDK